MIKRYISLFLLAVILLTVIMPAAYAHPKQEQHWADMELVLFGDSTFKSSISEKAVENKLTAIEYATALAIDQYKGNDGRWLQFLKIDMCIPDLPENVTDTKENSPSGINYTSSFNEHRQYTHKGWDLSPSPYGSADIANWPVRQGIMINTFSRMLGFNYLSGKPDPKCDALCALVYYVHIIGDQEKDSKYAPGSVIIPLGRYNNLNTNSVNESNPDVFSQLEYYLPRLFKDQKSTWTYKRLLKKIQRLSKKVRELDKNGISPDEQAEYQQYAEDTIELLSKYVPKLLKEEPFFASVFYKE